MVVVNLVENLQENFYTMQSLLKSTISSSSSAALLLLLFYCNVLAQEELDYLDYDGIYISMDFYVNEVNNNIGLQIGLHVRTWALRSQPRSWPTWQSRRGSRPTQTWIHAKRVRNKWAYSQTNTINILVYNTHYTYTQVPSGAILLTPPNLTRPREEGGN